MIKVCAPFAFYIKSHTNAVLKQLQHFWKAAFLLSHSLLGTAHSTCCSMTTFSVCTVRCGHRVLHLEDVVSLPAFLKSSRDKKRSGQTTRGGKKEAKVRDFEHSPSLLRCLLCEWHCHVCLTSYMLPTCSSNHDHSTKFTTQHVDYRAAQVYLLDWFTLRKSIVTLQHHMKSWQENVIQP